MSDKSKEALNRITNLEDRIINSGERFLNFVEKVNRMAVPTKRIVDENLLRREAVGSMPLTVAKEHEEEILNLESLLSQHCGLLEKHLKPIPQYDEPKIESGTAISSIASSILFDIADKEKGRFGESSNSEAVYSWGEIYANTYITRQSKKAEYIVEKLRKLDPQIAKEFDEAVKVYNKWGCHLIDPISLGNHLRNTLEHFQGRLMQKAIQHPREQNVNKWEEIAKRLSKGREGSVQCNAFIGLEKEKRDVWDMTMNLEKGIDNKIKKMGLDLSEASIKTIFAKWLSFFDAVLPLIDLKHFS